MRFFDKRFRLKYVKTKYTPQCRENIYISQFMSKGTVDDQSHNFGVNSCADGFLRQTVFPRNKRE